MSHSKYIEENLNEKFKTRVAHYHPGNSTDEDRDGNKYVTVAQIVTRPPLVSAVVGMGVAECGKKDNPSRKLGRRIAVGRAIKYAFECSGFDVLK